MVGSQPLIDWLSNRARSYVFSTAPPDAYCAAALRSLDLVEQYPERGRQLLRRALEFRECLRSEGWNTGRSASQIVSLVIGSPGETMQRAARLRRVGFCVPGIRPPSVPEGESLLRISLIATHSPQMITALLDALRK